MNSNIHIFSKLGGIFILALIAAIIVGDAHRWSDDLFGHFASPQASSTQSAGPEVDEEDPSFISGLSRVVDYSPDVHDLESEEAVPIVPAITGPLTASAYLVEDVSTGKILAYKNSSKVVPIASLTKLVTAEVSRQLMPAGHEIDITDSILAAYGSNGHLREGETISAGELLYPLLLVSSNDAAEALAQGYGATGQAGRKDFIRAMNDWVHSIGAYRTNFYDPSGLSPLTVSTASDMAIIANWIRVNDPALLAITDQRSATVRLHTWTNSAHFMNLSDYRGGKDGYIPEAGETAASFFSADTTTTASSSPARYLVVVLGSQNRDNDVLSLLKQVEGK